MGDRHPHIWSDGEAAGQIEQLGATHAGRHNLDIGVVVAMFALLDQDHSAFSLG
jgi:hypothetical protein